MLPAVVTEACESAWQSAIMTALVGIARKLDTKSEPSTTESGYLEMTESVL